MCIWTAVLLINHPVYQKTNKQTTKKGSDGIHARKEGEYTCWILETLFGEAKLRNDRRQNMQEPWEVSKESGTQGVKEGPQSRLFYRGTYPPKFKDK